MAGSGLRRLSSGAGGCNRLLAASVEELSEQTLSPGANRALPAVIFGVIGEVGEIDGQRIACHGPLNGCIPKTRAKSVCGRIVKGAHRDLASKKWLVVDAGVKIGRPASAGIERYVSVWRPISPLDATSLPHIGKGRKPELWREGPSAATQVQRQDAWRPATRPGGNLGRSRRENTGRDLGKLVLPKSCPAKQARPSTCMPFTTRLTIHPGYWLPRSS